MSIDNRRGESGPDLQADVSVEHKRLLDLYCGCDDHLKIEPSKDSLNFCGFVVLQREMIFVE